MNALISNLRFIPLGQNPNIPILQGVYQYHDYYFPDLISSQHLVPSRVTDILSVSCTIQVYFFDSTFVLADSGG